MRVVLKGSETSTAGGRSPFLPVYASRVQARCLVAVDQLAAPLVLRPSRGVSRLLLLFDGSPE